MAGPSSGDYADWAFLPPPAIQVIGTQLPSSSILRARLINKHWANCLAGVVDTLYVVPESFQSDAETSGLIKAFPKATTVNLDLQDTFMAVPKDVKVSLERYAAHRVGLPYVEPETEAPTPPAAAAADGAVAGAAAPAPAAGAAAGVPAAPNAAAPAAGNAPAAAPPAAAAAAAALAAQQLQQGQAAAAAAGNLAGQQQPQQQNPIAALAAAFAAGLLNGNPNVAMAAAANVAGLLGAPGQPAAALVPPAPTFPHSAITSDPVLGIVPNNTTHLRVRMPDNMDLASHFSDMNTSWDYVSGLLSRVGTKLSGLSLSTAPGGPHISMLQPLTQLTSLTMDEASHSTWSAEHLPIVGSLTRLRNLAIKIPPYRSQRPEPAPGSPAVQQPGALASWTALQQLTKLHVSALRYSFHSSLVAVLPHLTKLEYLALRAPQTRLPWPGTDKPLFAHIGMLTGLTQLSLALGDHNMQPQDWQSLTTLGRLSAIELSVSEGSDGLNVPVGLDFPALRSLKLRYPNSQDLVRIAMWSGVQKLDIKFPEHEREWHQEDAVVELMELRAKLPPSAGIAIIASVLDNAPAAQLAAVAAAGAMSADAPGTRPGVTAPGSNPATLGVVQAGAAVAAAAVIAATATAAATGNAGLPQPPTGAGNLNGLTAWWSPLLPLLALPGMTDFRCSAKEGLASHDPILFDDILSGLCAAWPGITRLCFKGCINVATQTTGWDSLRVLTKLQQLELRHHPPGNEEQGVEHTANRARSRYVRVEPIKLPATSLPDSLQTLLLENVELRRKETDCLSHLTSLERRTTCRHFPEFEGMPLQRLVVSNCCVKAKGITSIATECAGLTHLVFAVYKVTEQADLRELQAALRQMVRSLSQLQVLKVRVLAGCITQDLVEDMVTYLQYLQRLKLTSSDGWQDTALFLPLTKMAGLRKCSLAYFKSVEAARLLRAEFRAVLPYCKIKAKHEQEPRAG
ncbi:hypothetical protein HXX76_001724 [Chlamydomonas incerta]|uniref:Uncharacterized protein n=1 Tax=Chlamydomonas incerta TaxID=51695 RepID=A0A835TDY7_CHLIN|nr:hypothetical protein HXX76_001724 [Chlamydomonas incerta]|eukprot:KAG2443363.1 hypothetical protein HXX76_001724 [Chlamydomonas incerta]